MSIINGVRTTKQKVISVKGRKSGSTAWLRRHINDPYVHLTKQKNYRSRAAFKLLEIDEKFHFIRGARNIVDLGAAPGGWLQILIEQASKNNTKIIGVDLLDIEPLSDIHLLQGNFLEEQTQKEMQILFEHSSLCLILSDMAVNSCGDKQVDHLRNSALIEETLRFSERYLKRGGNLVAKTIRGGEEQYLLKLAKEQFKQVKLFKPQASYANSAEIYMIAISKK